MWCVTETPDDPSLNTHWVGEAKDAMDALDQFAVAEGFIPYSDLIKEEGHEGMVGTEVTWPEPLPLPEGAMWATFTNTTVYAIPFNVDSPYVNYEALRQATADELRQIIHDGGPSDLIYAAKSELTKKEENVKTYDTPRKFTIPQLDATIAKIEQSIRDWEEGRMTSPDERDHVIAGCEVLGVDWHQIDRDTDNDIVGKIANEIYEDAGETITDVRDLATHILQRLYEEGLRPVEGESLQAQFRIQAEYRGSVAGYAVVGDDYKVQEWFPAPDHQSAMKLRDKLNAGEVEPQEEAEQNMYLSVRLDGEEIQGYPLIDGDDSFNATSERSAIDFAYDTLERTRHLSGEVAIHVLPEPPKDEEEEPIKREILVHLNVEVEAFDTRTPDQIADFLLACIEVGGEGHESSEGIGTIVVPLAEEI